MWIEFTYPVVSTNGNGTTEKSADWRKRYAYMYTQWHKRLPTLSIVHAFIINHFSEEKTNIKCMFTSIWLLPTFSPFWTSFFRPLLLLVFDTKIIYRFETCKYFMWIVLSFLPILANIASINFQTALVVFFSLDILSSLYLTLRHIKWQCKKRNWIPMKWMLRVCNMFEYPC